MFVKLILMVGESQVKKRYFENFKTNLLYGGKFVHNSLYNTNVLWTKNPPKNEQENIT